MDARADIGQRIARQRRRKGLSQPVVARLIGRSESWLSQVERGLRSIDSYTVLSRLAALLDLEIGQLTTNDTDAGMGKYKAAEAVREAILRYETLPTVINSGTNDAERPRLKWLSHELRQVNHLYQATQYDEAGRRLPGLIIAAERASQTRNGNDRRTAHTLRALIYQPATMTLNRVGEADLAWTAADRSLSAAQVAERPLLAAVGAYRLGYVLIRQ